MQLLRPIAFLLGLATAGLASAAPADLGTWNTAGDVVVDSATAVRLTTAAVESGETPLGSGSALQFYELEPALQLAPGALPADSFEGSGLFLRFDHGQPLQVSFDWTLTTTGFDADYRDRGFVALGGQLIAPLGQAQATPVSGRFSLLLQPGSHALAFGVLDVNAVDGVSTLSIGQFSVSAVPEPGTWALWLAGASGLLAWRRRASTRR
ncbi:MULTISPECIES: PEP-CTERM sorting domain-containing protein [Aquincola]|uniref:PEP-CTERM sorting domain-containing protein n=1 Tax=Aquincola TaxID=391952 RepID=UPI000614D500|nr:MULTISPECIES: PEP-CTERM sorting domain-containing protein [Aquincola]MCR5864451.1 PEP-CTERM sorting domain-containing protein [Aquincola sp. J276]